MSDVRPQAQEADIALLLEGTFPYVSGGVSSWINQIIRAYPEYRFAIIFLGSRREDYSGFKYELPSNVVHFEEHYLYEHLGVRSMPARRRGDRAALEMVRTLVDSFRLGDRSPAAIEAFQRISLEMQPGGRLPLEDFLYSERAWEIICQSYREHCTDPSFVDYFWTVRIMYQPLWMLARVARSMLRVRMVHSASTGYAGYLGGLVRQMRGVPLILSEHGIYTKERKIDLFKSEWIRDNRNIFQRDPTELSYFRQMWIQFFEWLGYYCYAAADPIIALYEANRLRQVADGADPARTFNIPNGIKLGRFAPLRGQRPAEVPPILCPHRPGGPHQGHQDLHPRDAARGEPAARRRRLDRRPHRGGPGLRAGVREPRAQPGPGEQRAFPGLPEGGRPHAAHRADHPLVHQRGAAPGAAGRLCGRRAGRLHSTWARAASSSRGWTRKTARSAPPARSCPSQIPSSSRTRRCRCSTMRPPGTRPAAPPWRAWSATTPIR